MVRLRTGERVHYAIMDVFAILEESVTQYNRRPCMIHNLQLVVKLPSQDRFLKHVLQKIQKIVSAIRHSVSAQHFNSYLRISYLLNSSHSIGPKLNRPSHYFVPLLISSHPKSTHFRWSQPAFRPAIFRPSIHRLADSRAMLLFLFLFLLICLGVFNISSRYDGTDFVGFLRSIAANLEINL